MKLTCKMVVADIQIITEKTSAAKAVALCVQHNNMHTGFIFLSYKIIMSFVLTLCFKTFCFHINMLHIVLKY